MIEITAGHLSVSVSGHANSVPAGERDLVCNAVSVLVHTLVAALSQLSPYRAECQEGKGHAAIAVHHPCELTDLMIDMFCVGCAEIAELYPQYIRYRDCRSLADVKTRE